MRKKILLFGLVAALLAFSGCLGEPEEEDECADLTGFEMDVCYSGKAVNELKSDTCHKVSDSETKDDCFLAVAASGGEYLCGAVKDSFKSDTCHYMRAITFVKEDFCYDIRDSEAEQVCLEDVAKKK